MLRDLDAASPVARRVIYVCHAKNPSHSLLYCASLLAFRHPMYAAQVQQAQSDQRSWPCTGFAPLSVWIYFPLAVCYWTLMVSGCSVYVPDQKSWEQKRATTLKRINSAARSGCRQVQPQRRTIQHYLLKNHGDLWLPRALHTPIKTTEDRLWYACQYKWGASAHYAASNDWNILQ